MKLLIVRALWHVCGIVDRLPEWSVFLEPHCCLPPEDRRWYRGSQSGVSGRSESRVVVVVSTHADPPAHEAQPLTWDGDNA